MKPPPFSYHDPRTVADVVGLLGSLENAKLFDWPAVESLMPMLNMRFVLPDHIIDLNRVEGLSYIRANGALEIGAMTRQRSIEFSDAVRERSPLMHEAIRQVGHRQTRNRGTLGGSLCHLDPAAELVTLAAAFDAKVTVAGKSGTRSIDFASFPVAYITPALEPDELLTGASFPCWPKGRGYAFIELRVTGTAGSAMVLAAVLIEEDRQSHTRFGDARRHGTGAGARQRGRKGADRRDDRREAHARYCRRCACEAIEDIHARRFLPPATGDGAAAPRVSEGANASRKGSGMSENCARSRLPCLRHALRRPITVRVTSLILVARSG